jgi:Protein of unknown function (DUF3040)
MSLRAGQQRSLDRIESTLLQDDLHLASLFATFTRLAREEAMPATERVTAGRWQRLRPALAAAFGLAAVVTVLVLSLLTPGRPACHGDSAAAPAHLQPFRAGQQASCRPAARAFGPAAGLDGR